MSNIHSPIFNCSKYICTFLPYMSNIHSPILNYTFYLRIYNYIWTFLPYMSNIHSPILNYTFYNGQDRIPRKIPRFSKRWPQLKLNSPVPMELRWQSIVKYITTFNFKVKSEIQIDVSIFYNTMQKLIWNGHWKHILKPFWHFISDRWPWRHPTAKVDITIKIAEKSNIWINHALNRL